MHFGDWHSPWTGSEADGSRVSGSLGPPAGVVPGCVRHSGLHPGRSDRRQLALRAHRCFLQFVIPVYSSCSLLFSCRSETPLDTVLLQGQDLAQRAQHIPVEGVKSDICPSFPSGFPSSADSEVLPLAKIILAPFLFLIHLQFRFSYCINSLHVSPWVWLDWAAPLSVPRPRSCPPRGESSHLHTRGFFLGLLLHLCVPASVHVLLMHVSCGRVALG